MIFKDLKLPKEITRKKKLELFKCWILDPLSKKDPSRELGLNTDKDRYGLTPEAAFHLRINQIGLSDFLGDTVEKVFNEKFVVLAKLILSDVMDEEVIIPPEGDENMNCDPQYDPQVGVLSATIHNRVADMELKNYVIQNVELEQDPATGIINVKKLELREAIINNSVTGNPKVEIESTVEF